MDIWELLNRRSDISAFLVHLCRDVDGINAHSRLQSILSSNPPQIMSNSGKGLYHDDLQLNTNAVCFTETPLEHIYTLVAPIENKRYEYRKYGLVFTKQYMRKRGACPIWYINHLQEGGSNIRTALDNLRISLNHSQMPHFEQIAPFLEVWHQMPLRDFYWEREWRYRGHFSFQLSDATLGICPEIEITTWECQYPQIKFIDPAWGLDRIVDKLS
jgi:hypothetical protein